MKLLNYVMASYWALILVLFVFGYKPTDLIVAVGFINSALLFFFNGKGVK
jgi:hypothetical protein